MTGKMRATYTKDETRKSWWCTSHNRKAEFVCSTPSGFQRHCCDPSLGGILLPCECIELTGMINNAPDAINSQAFIKKLNADYDQEFGP